MHQQMQFTPLMAQQENAAAGGRKGFQHPAEDAVEHALGVPTAGGLVGDVVDQGQIAVFLAQLRLDAAHLAHIPQHAVDHLAFAEIAKAGMKFAVHEPTVPAADEQVRLLAIAVAQDLFDQAQIAAALSAGKEFPEREIGDGLTGVTEELFPPAVDVEEGAGFGMDEEDGVAGIVEQLLEAQSGLFGGLAQSGVFRFESTALPPGETVAANQVETGKEQGQAGQEH